MAYSFYIFFVSATYKLMMQQTDTTHWAEISCMHPHTRDNAETRFTLLIIHADYPQPDENQFLLPVGEKDGKVEFTVPPTSDGVQQTIQPHSQVMY